MTIRGDDLLIDLPRLLDWGMVGVFKDTGEFGALFFREIVVAGAQGFADPL